ncbi:unnamed protein product [Paramecium sonneborni]|uniref:Transmembrane protein n=1 Tax=Paramecium sonneborni TaxID=65129 RepID=A0A8S1LV90_9CILI|nr:unnamed protein product [Paramecium sonneborni]
MTVIFDKIILFLAFVIDFEDLCISQSILIENITIIQSFLQIIKFQQAISRNLSIEETIWFSQQFKEQILILNEQKPSICCGLLILQYAQMLDKIYMNVYRIKQERMKFQCLKWFQQICQVLLEEYSIQSEINFIKIYQIKEINRKLIFQSQNTK